MGSAVVIVLQQPSRTDLCALCFLLSARVTLRRNFIVNDAWQHPNVCLAAPPFRCKDWARHHAEFIALPLLPCVVWTPRAVGIGGNRPVRGNSVVDVGGFFRPSPSLWSGIVVMIIDEQSGGRHAVPFSCVMRIQHPHIRRYCRRRVIFDVTFARRCASTSSVAAFSTSWTKRSTS